MEPDNALVPITGFPVQDGVYEDGRGSLISFISNLTLVFKSVTIYL